MAKNTRDIAYKYIQDMIIQSDMNKTVILSENAIARELGISRTPIREAMRMLEADGLVENIPNKGPIVKKMNINDIVYLTQIRQGLEGVAARVACERADKQALKAVQERLETLNDLSDQAQRDISIKAGRELHQLLLDSTDNQRMIRIVNNMRTQLDRICYLSRYECNRAEKTYRQHMDILEAVMKGDSDAADKAMREHLSSVSMDATNALCRSFLM